MKKTLYYGIVGFVLYAGACKSDRQEPQSGMTSDTTRVAGPRDMVVNVEPPTKNEKQRTISKKADHITSNTTAKGQDSKITEAEDLTTITQQDMEYNEFPAKPAAYPGGTAALNQYLAEHIRYPAQARENKIEGTVYANILVDESGTLGDVTFLKPLGYGLEEEVLKAIKGMPKLIPAEDQGKPVKTKFILPVKFYMK